MSLAGKQVLVTGATGFIGNRLVEALGGMPGVGIRALVHQFMNASRIARFPVAMFGGSVLDHEAVSAAMEGVDVVFHLAYGARGSTAERRRNTVDGTRVVCEEVLRRGVKRLVYTSTFSVYGATADGDLSERAPRKRSGDVYADSKLAAENLVLDYSHRRELPAVILQPTVVYGPFSYWSRWPIDQLKDGTVVLPDTGNGFCNAVYVDDVVDALLLAAEVPGVEGEVFLISGEKPCTWLEYYRGYAGMLGRGGIDFEPADQMPTRTAATPGSASAILALLRRARKSARLRHEALSIPAVHAAYRGIKKALPTRTWARLHRLFTDRAASVAQATARPRCYPTRPHLALFRSKTHVRIDQAVEKLGYRSRTSLVTGLAKTAQWARWFGLLP